MSVVDKLADKLRTARALRAEKGTYFVCRRAACRVAYPFWGYRLVGGKRSFEFRGQSVRYFYHRYNTAWRNERAVEIPIALGALSAPNAARVLEVGNVLRHYLPGASHIVVDKYEQAPDVLNVDVIDYATDVPFNLILSISTLEHVGWDEDPREPEKSIRAVIHLMTLLADGGRLLFTVPLGYNPHLDAALVDGRAGVDRITYLERTTQSGVWKERELNQIKHRAFNDPYPGAGAVSVCEYRKPG